jgi:CBS domain-containing protein
MNENSRVSLLADTPGFRGTDLAILRALLANAAPRALADGEVLFSTGEEFRDEIYMLETGRVKRTRPGGVAHYPPPGYLLGLSSYLGESTYTSSVSAVSEARVLAIRAKDLDRLEKEFPALFDAFNRTIALGIRDRSVIRPPLSGTLTHTVRSAMSAPVLRCGGQTTLRRAHSLMSKAGVGSVVITDESDRPTGVLTYATLSSRLMQAGADPDSDTAESARRKPVLIPADEPLWKAQELQQGDGVRHVVVVEDGKAVGLISQTDIVRLLVSRHGVLATALQTVDEVSGLHAQYEKITDIASELLESNRFARVAIRTLSEAHLAIQRRCVELTLEEIAAEGGGAPPTDYALIIMGSGGRGEMMLDPDQDNGLILPDEADVEKRDVSEWFRIFSNRLNINLDRAGYILCPGDIMARNPMFHKPLHEWKQQISAMTLSPSEKAARWSNIVFDFNTLYGSHRLTGELRAHVHESLSARPRLLQFMVSDDAKGQPSLNWFNRLVTTGERDGKQVIDVKRNGMRIVINAARIFALRDGVSSCNTNDRIQGLAHEGTITPDFAATITAAYDELLDILVSHQIRQRREGREPTKSVAPEDLPSSARESLRIAMHAVKRFQDYLQSEIGETELF